jgi:hypothetical protein
MVTEEGANVGSTAPCSVKKVSRGVQSLQHEMLSLSVLRGTA